MKNIYVIILSSQCRTMSAQFANVKSYPVSVSNQDIPSAWMSNQDPRVASATKRIVNVSSSTGTQNSGGLVSFILPAGQGAGFLASGSAYMKFTVTITQATAYSWSFAQYGSASSVVNRMTLLSSGAISEQILNYNKTYSALLLHASNPSFACGDDKLNQQSFNGALNAGALGEGANIVTVAIPILLGAFNSKQHYPLCLINSAQLNVDLDTVVNAITQASGDALTDYAVSSASLVFEQIIPDQQYEQGLRAMLASGRLFQMPISTFYNVRTAQTGAVTQNIGLNCSSLKAVLWSTVPVETQRGSKQFTNANQTSARLYLDGSLQFAGNLSDEISQFLEMNRALNTMWDSDRVSCAPTAYAAGNVADANGILLRAGGITRALYSDGAYLGGLSCAKSSESGFAMKGVPVNSAVLEFVGDAGGTFYIMCCVEQILTFDAMGNASLIR